MVTTEDPKPTTFDRIDHLASLIAAQVDKEIGSERVFDTVKRIARAAIGDSPLRFPDELADPIDPADVVDLVFDGPPGPEGPRFIEAEDRHGRSVNVGQWIDTADGQWRLRIPTITLGVNFLSERPVPTAIAMPPTLREAELVGRATALAEHGNRAGLADVEAVRDLAVRVAEDARFARAIMRVGREFLFGGIGTDGRITEQELYEVHRLVTVYMRKAKESAEPIALDGQASALLVHALVDRTNTLVDLIDTWCDASSARDELRCAHCAKTFPKPEMPGHAAECSMSPVVHDLAQTRSAHDEACHLLAQVWHAATGKPWGDGPARGILEDVQDRVEEWAAGLLTKYEDGAAVYLSSHAGGAHPAGEWGTLTLRFVEPGGRERFGDYVTNGPLRDAQDLPESFTLADVRDADAKLREIAQAPADDGTIEVPPAPKVRHAGGMRSTRTYALMEVSRPVFAEIRAKLRDAGYDHAIHEEDKSQRLDMAGIALTERPLYWPEQGANTSAVHSRAAADAIGSWSILQAMIRDARLSAKDRGEEGKPVIISVDPHAMIARWSRQDRENLFHFRGEPCSPGCMMVAGVHLHDHDVYLPPLVREESGKATPTPAADILLSPGERYRKDHQFVMVDAVALLANEANDIPDPDSVPPTPARVANTEEFWDKAPPERSPRCAWWLERFSGGWRPNKRIRSMGYYEAAQFYGVFIWEYVNVISPALGLTTGRVQAETQPPA